MKERAAAGLRGIETPRESLRFGPYGGIVDHHTLMLLGSSYSVVDAMHTRFGMTTQMIRESRLRCAALLRQKTYAGLST
jgi:hypothetical protein